MKKLDLNIVLKEKEQEVKVEKDGTICFKDRVNNAGELVKDAEGKVVKERVLIDIKATDSALKWIENSIIRVMNGTTIDGKPTKQPSLDIKANWKKLSNVLENHNKGIVILETDDYKFLDENFNKVEQIANPFVDYILLAIRDAIRTAENYDPNLNTAKSKNDKNNKAKK